MASAAMDGGDATTGRARAQARRRSLLRRLPAIVGTLPMSFVAIGLFVVGLGFTVVLSFTNSKLFPSFDWVGLTQYSRLWATPRWVESVKHIWIYGAGL